MLISSQLGLAYITTLALYVLSYRSNEKPEALSNTHWEKFFDVFLPGGFAQSAAYGYAIKDCKQVKQKLGLLASCLKNCSECERYDIGIIKDLNIANNSAYIIQLSITG